MMQLTLADRLDPDRSLRPPWFRWRSRRAYDRLMGLAETLPAEFLDVDTSDISTPRGRARFMLYGELALRAHAADVRFMRGIGLP